MSPGCSGCCRPGQPVFPYARRPRATCGRDTLPLCLGSNCSLDKERPGLAASVKQRLYEDREACQRPAWFFLLFPNPGGMNGNRGQRLLCRSNSVQPIVYIDSRGVSRSFLSSTPHLPYACRRPVIRPEFARAENRVATPDRPVV